MQMLESTILRRMNLFKQGGEVLHSPHVPIGSSLALALSMLDAGGGEVHPLDGDVRAYRSLSKEWDLIIYAAADEVDAVSYNDPAGRGFFESKLVKVHLYLSRYGPLADWELRMDNGWMRYWFNPTAHVAMVYGIHEDVIRFNRYDGE